MEAIIIATSKDLDLSYFERLLRDKYQVSRVLPDQVIIESGPAAVSLHHSPDLWLEYVEDESTLGKILELIPDPEFFIVDYSWRSIELLRGVIRLIGSDGRVVIDNGFGTVARGPDLVARLNASPDWDWRDDVPTVGEDLPPNPPDPRSPK